MNEFDNIDSELEAAITQRPSTLSRPSLRDVKQRARRHQRQRSAGVLGACAVFGVGGVAVIAQRSPSNETTVGGLEGDPTTTMCVPATTYVVDETVPYTLPAYTGPTVTASTVTESESSAPMRTVVITSPAGVSSTTGPANYGATFGTYTLAEGDFPGSVAQMFGLTVAELDAANLDVAGYGPFAVGTVINIPSAGNSPIPTTFPLSATTTTNYNVPTVTGPCGSTTTYNYRCTGSGSPVIESVEADGWWYFEYCETVGYGEIVVNGEPVGPTTISFTKTGTAIQVVNTSNQEGAARFLANALAAEGFTMVEPDTGTIDLPVTKVMYNPDDPNAQAVAQSVAIVLGNAEVEPSGPVVPTLTLGTWAPGSSVIVLLGDDLAGKSLAQISAPPTTTLAPTSTSA